MHISKILATVFLSATLGCISKPNNYKYARAPERNVPTLFKNDAFAVAAANIKSPADFRKFEPIIEEMTGFLPVSTDYIFFSSEMEKLCGDRKAEGCFDQNNQNIYVNYKNSEKNEILFTYAHEQGHYFQNWSYSEEWVNELRAHAFALYFAEKIATHDKIFGRVFLAYAEKMIFEEAIATKGFKPGEEAHSLGSRAIVNIWASGSFSSYKELWEYVNAHPFLSFMKSLSNDNKYTESIKKWREKIKEVNENYLEKL